MVFVSRIVLFIPKLTLPRQMEAMIKSCLGAEALTILVGESSWLGLHIVTKDTSIIDLSQEILSIDMLTALKCFFIHVQHRRKHVQ